MQLKNLGSNRTAIRTNSGSEVFFSYNTPVAAFVAGEGYFRTDQFFSVTTSKHINQWLDGIEAGKKPQEFFENLIK